MTEPSDEGGSDSPSQREDRVTNERNYLFYQLDQRFDAVHEELLKIRTAVEATNGSVKKLELWQATVQGAIKATGWIGPLVTGVTVGAILLLISH